MKNRRRTLWLLILLVSQLMSLLGSMLEPPTSWLTTLLRVVVPLLAVVFIALMLAGYVSSRKE